MQLIQGSRLFQINQDIVLSNDIKGVVEGYYTPSDVIVRVKNNIDKSNERYMRQFKCLTPNGQASRLYVIPEKELVRHGQKGQTSKVAKKRTKAK